MTGLITKAVSGFYYVEFDNILIECKARGRFRNDGTSLLVGDIVEFSFNGDKGTVEKVLNRKNFLKRPPVANIDKLFIISSAVSPRPNLLLIDRMTALCEHNNILPVIVFNKADCKDVSEYEDIYSSVGYKTLVCSAAQRQGIEPLKKELEGGISVFTGNSGVGKSSLLNVLFPNLCLSTGEVSEKLGRGRHTTRHCELFRHEFDGYVADTPGFSSLEADLNDIDFKDNLELCFPEFKDFIGDCKFADCRHIGEKGCAVLQGVNEGKIRLERYESYKTIYNELKDIKIWNIK